MEFPDQASFQEYAQSTGRTYVTIEVGEKSQAKMGALLVELYDDICPKTCEHFLRLLTGKGQAGFKYAGTPFHRLVKHGFIQGGDVVDGTGKGDPGFTLPDETFAVKHDEAGILAMANNGAPHTAASQFYITLAPLPSLDGKRVAFGRLLTTESLEALKLMSEVPCNYAERPTPEIVIQAARQIYPKPE
eukprot:gene5536-4170_t